jgi:hypothetical protein
MDDDVKNAGFWDRSLWFNRGILHLTYVCVDDIKEIFHLTLPRTSHSARTVLFY